MKKILICLFCLFLTGCVSNEDFEKTCTKVINSENIKFGVNYPYDFSEDVQHTMKKINNIDEFGYADGLYEITFSGARAPSSIYLSINVTPINTAMELPFLKISLRKY